MTDCLKYKEQIELELDGELSLAEQVELDRHLLLCPDCIEYKAGALVLFSALDTGILIEPPASMVGPVLANIAKRRAWRLLGFSAILILTVISLGPVFWHGICWTMKIILSWEPEWLTTLWQSVWRIIRVLHRTWVMLSSAMPDEYWLGLTMLAAVNLVMLLKLLGFRPVKGGGLL